MTLQQVLRAHRPISLFATQVPLSVAHQIKAVFRGEAGVLMGVVVAEVGKKIDSEIFAENHVLLNLTEGIKTERFCGL